MRWLVLAFIFCAGAVLGPLLLLLLSASFVLAGAFAALLALVNAARHLHVYNSRQNL